MLSHEFGKVYFTFYGVKQNNLICSFFSYLCLFLFLFFTLVFYLANQHYLLFFIPNEFAL